MGNFVAIIMIFSLGLQQNRPQNALNFSVNTARAALASGSPSAGLLARATRASSIKMELCTG